jgi:hypothetical protein
MRMEHELIDGASNRTPFPAAPSVARPDQTPTAPWAHGGITMRALIAKMKIPASESQLSLALGLSVLVMSGLLWAILWQSNIIVQQREAIRYLWSLHGGHMG